MIEFQNNYYASKDGHIYSTNYTEEPKKLNAFLRKDGYVAVAIHGKGIKRRTVRVHRIIAQAYILNPENKPQVNHLDGNKSNNAVSNLEWVTAKENTKHAWDTGLSTFAVKSLETTKGLRKLSFKDAESIRDRYKPRCKINGLRALSREYGIDKQSVKKILDRITYKEGKQNE